jgi:hypothetical protein
MSLLVKLGVGAVAGVAGFFTLAHMQSTGSSLAYRLDMPALASLTSLVGIGASAATGTGGPIDKTFPARSVHIDGLVANVEIVTIPQGPIRVQANGKPETMKELQVHAVGDEVFIRLDSEEDKAWFPWNMFNMWGKDRKVQDLKVRISAPLGTPFDIEDIVGGIVAGDLDAPLRLDGSSVNARFGRVQSARIGIAGSGRITVGAIKETLDIDVAGSGRFEAASAAAVNVDIAGGGDVFVGPVAGGFSADIAGSGDIRVAQINGPVDIDIAGSGGVIIDGGRANPFSVEIAGSGDVVFKGEAVNPNVEIYGSGSVKVNSYTGSLKQEIAGSGEFQVMNHGPGQAQPAPPTGPTPPAPPPPPARP